MAGGYERMRAAMQVVHAAWKHGAPTVPVAVRALEDAQLLQSPETAAELTARRTEDLTLRGELAPATGPRAVPFELGASLAPAVQWLISRVAELEAAPTTVYRAQHDSIPMGLYTTREAARAHCEAYVRREVGDEVILDWVPDDGSEDAPEELCTGYDAECTGYVVTPLTVASAYDPEVDE